ncbi:MAG: hypothetical protein VR69_01190 [Peptococcaceae bacterium BRH_c4b]|nr:MAG: hypothetical protein VR69_01190 [Peptococcaceae bacterium BRH_c4b]
MKIDPEKFIKAAGWYEQGLEKGLEDGVISAGEVDGVRLNQYRKDLRQGQAAHETIAASKAEEAFGRRPGEGSAGSWGMAMEKYKSVVYDGLESAVKLHRIMKLYDVLS